MRLPHFILTILLVCFAATASFAQKGKVSELSFERTAWDFGTINEVDGPVSHTFKFTNTGKTPIVLEQVVVSCGCTTPEYTREPVMPGARGEIKITFDPKDRPGAFAKDIHVSSGGGKNKDKITIRGEVVGRPRSIEEDYPYELGGGLRLQRFDANFSYVERGKPSSMTVGYVNTSDKPVKLDYSVVPATGNISVSALPTICAGCRGDITITYDMRGSSTYGRVGHRVDLWVDGKKETLGITTTAIVVDRYAPGDTAAAPRIKLQPQTVDLGDVENGGTVKVEFSIKNDGADTLIIRAVQPRKGMIVDLGKNTEIAPGMELKVRTSIKVSGTKGSFFADGIYITTNDPVSPMKEFRIMGKIK